MRIKQDVMGGTGVIRLSGQLMGGPDADQVRESIAALLQQGKKSIVIDLNDVLWVNSTGLGVLISSHILAENQGGTLKLMRISKRIESIFSVTRLDTVFEVYEDEASALASCAE